MISVRSGSIAWTSLREAAVRPAFRWHRAFGLPGGIGLTSPLDRARFLSTTRRSLPSRPPQKWSIRNVDAEIGGNSIRNALGTDEGPQGPQALSVRVAKGVQNVVQGLRAVLRKAALQVLKVRRSNRKAKRQRLTKGSNPSVIDLQKLPPGVHFRLCCRSCHVAHPSMTCGSCAHDAVFLLSLVMPTADTSRACPYVPLVVAEVSN